MDDDLLAALQHLWQKACGSSVRGTSALVNCIGKFCILQDECLAPGTVKEGDIEAS